MNIYESITSLSEIVLSRKEEFELLNMRKLTKDGYAEINKHKDGAIFLSWDIFHNRTPMCSVRHFRSGTGIINPNTAVYLRSTSSFTPELETPLEAEAFYKEHKKKLDSLVKEATTAFLKTLPKT